MKTTKTTVVLNAWRIHLIAFIFILAVCTVFPGDTDDPNALAPAATPNLIIYVTDDMGGSDVGFPEVPSICRPHALAGAE